MSTLSYLSQPKNKQKLNAFLHIYEVYKDTIGQYLNNPTAPSNKELNIFYIRELMPIIQHLVKELRLNIPTIIMGFKFPTNYTPFTSLFVIEKLLRDEKKNLDDAKAEVSYIYGKIKELTEHVKAVLQEPIPEVENVINRGRELIILSQTIQPDPSSADIPHFFPHKGWWWISSIGKSGKRIKLFKERTLRGELLNVLNEAVVRTKESVYEFLEEKTGEQQDGIQIINAVKDINRKLSENKIPRLRLVNGGDTWQLVFKKTHE